MPAVGSKLVQSKLGETLEYLGRVGLDDFYVGDMAKIHGDFLAKAGSPLIFEDLTRFCQIGSAILIISLSDLSTILISRVVY